VDGGVSILLSCQTRRDRCGLRRCRASRNSIVISSCGLIVSSNRATVLPQSAAYSTPRAQRAMRAQKATATATVTAAMTTAIEIPGQPRRGGCMRSERAGSHRRRRKPKRSAPCPEDLRWRDCMEPRLSPRRHAPAGFLRRRRPKRLRPSLSQRCEQAQHGQGRGEAGTVRR
jgi:hypothetical protein